MAAHLDRWARDTLATPDDWYGVLAATREWLGPADRKQRARELRAGSPGDDFSV